MERKTCIMRLSLLLCLTAIFSIVSGCAIMSKQDCLQGNWQEAGYNDAARGHTSASRLSSRIRVCSKHGATLNKVEYLLGYRDGLTNYCQPTHGFIAGSNNRTYRGICPQSLEPSFLQQYLDGLHTARRNVWLQHQWLDSELFNARVDRSYYRDNKDARLRIEARIDHISNKLDALRTAQLQIGQKIARWKPKLKAL